MKVLLTGATGFLGEYMIQELLENDYEVVAFGRNEKKGKYLSENYKNVKFVKGNLENREDLEKITDQIDFVIHAGGLSTVWGRWEDFYNANVLGTQNVLDFCEKQNVKRLVFVSSPSVYAKKGDSLQVKEEATLNMSPLPRVLAYQWNALTNLYGMLGGENLGVMVY